MITGSMKHIIKRCPSLSKWLIDSQCFCKVWFCLPIKAVDWMNMRGMSKEDYSFSTDHPVCEPSTPTLPAHSLPLGLLFTSHTKSENIYEQKHWQRRLPREER